MHEWTDPRYTTIARVAQVLRDEAPKRRPGRAPCPTCHGLCSVVLDTAETIWVCVCVGCGARGWT